MVGVMRRGAIFGIGVLTGAFVATAPATSSAQGLDGAALVRHLGAHAKDAFAPRGAPGMGAIVRLPAGVAAGDVGLRDLVPGFGRLWGSPASLLAFADAHPGLPLEVNPPLHLFLDTAVIAVNAPASPAPGSDGKNVLVGIADTGIDLTHPNFRDAGGGTRVQWLLDLSQAPLGKYPALEAKYASTAADGTVFGAVWAKADIDAALALAAPPRSMPRDEVGHGTLVAACAAAQDPHYRGIAPQAGLLIARVADTSGVIGNDEMLRGVDFLFDRADAMSQPVAVNLSLGGDFGPHDGTTDWEQVLASYVGPDHPGRALVVAAGNSGSIVDSAVHQNVYVNEGATMRVPVVTYGATNGGVEVWVAMHAGAHLQVGLDSPHDTWIQPVPENDSAGKNTSAYDAAVYNGSQASNSPVPAQSHGAVVVWQGQWDSGTYFVTLSGTGTADLYVDTTGDAVSSDPAKTVGFADAVREGTVSLPATHPAILGVGCTINKRSWRSITGGGIGFSVPLLDSTGGQPADDMAVRDPVVGEPCWFSGAGPTLTGIAKPEIMAPGAAIVGAMSQQALPTSPDAPASIFAAGDCPASPSGGMDTRCNEIDATHGAALGTSFSSPLVAGAVALLFQHDPTLTQQDAVAALQAGAHPLRAAAPFDDQAGAGELDVAGALAVVDGLRNPETALPTPAKSWMTLGANVYLADGSTPLEAIFELRAAEPAAPSGVVPADGFAPARLAAFALADGSRTDVPVRRAAPGVWVAMVSLPAGLGGSTLTVGATFDGVDVVPTKSVPIATDAWTANYAPRAVGGCAVARASRTHPGWWGWTLWAAALVLRKRSRRTL